LVPVKVTGTLAPCAPLAGLIEVSVGPAALIVKVTGALVPFEAVTVTLAGPVEAVDAIAKFALI
jgi:hypothetical protein